MSLDALALKPTLFIQFTNPATGELVFGKFPANHAQAGQENPEDPIGVRVYGPGSKEAKAAQTAITNEAIERKRKKVTAELIEANAVELLARTTYEFVGFEYKGQGASVEVCRKFYRDGEYAHLRDQVQDQAGDYGRFLTSVSTA